MSAARSPRPLTGRRVLAILLAFFGTVAAADALLLVAATRTWSGLDVASPYRAGQLYGEEVRRARAQDALGWRLAMDATRLPGTAALVRATLADVAGRPLPGRTLAARLERPTDKRQDVAVPLAEAAAGSYAATVAALAPGQWDLVVEVAEPEGTALRRRRRIVLD